MSTGKRSGTFTRISYRSALQSAPVLRKLLQDDIGVNYVDYFDETPTESSILTSVVTGSRATESVQVVNGQLTTPMPGQSVHASDFFGERVM